MVSKEGLPPGRHELGVAYRPGPGSVRLTLDGEELCAAPATSRRSYLAGNTLSGRLVIGRDQGLPVSDRYRPPFPFTGVIHRVIYEGLAPRPAPASEQLEVAMRED
jgi:arylsulfatase